MTTADGIDKRMSADPEKFKLAAFFSTVPHEVEEVKSGCRVTLTFSIDRDSEVRKLAHVKEREKMAWGPTYDGIFLKMLEDRECLGVLLRGRYTPEAVETHKLDALHDSCDLLLVNYLRDHLKLPLEVITVATTIDSTTDEAGDPDTWTSKVEQISVPLWESLMEWRGVFPSNEGDFFIPERAVTFVGYERFGGEKLTLRETLYANEAQPGELHCVHLNTALIVRPRQPVAKRPCSD